jgi:hypothetical protein
VLAVIRSAARSSCGTETWSRLRQSRQRAGLLARGDRVRNLWVKPRLPMDARWKQAADPEADLNQLRRRGVWLWAASMVLTLAVAVAAIAAGIVASSIALMGLGLDSAIELLAAAIVVWQLRSGRDTGENRAAGLIAVTFLAGAAYLAAESIHELASHHQSAHSAAGLTISSAALVVLAVLALAKRRVGQALGSVTLRADAAETGLSAAAAAAALLGAGLDDWLGWWWTVPAASPSPRSRSLRASKPGGTAVASGTKGTDLAQVPAPGAPRVITCKEPDLGQLYSSSGSPYRFAFSAAAVWPLLGRTMMLNVATYCALVSSISAGQQ